MYTTADVTIAIICSGESPLLRCFDGLLAQTADPARILIVDNGCWPGVSVESYIIHHLSCPVDVERIPEKVSTAAARNHALTLCNTPLLIELDPHVIPAPDWLQSMTDAIVPRCHCLAEKAEHVCAVGGRVDFLNPANGHERPPRNWGDTALENPASLWSGNVIFKTAAVRDAGGYPEDVAEGEEDAALAEQLRSNNGILLYVPGIKCAVV